MGSEIVVFLVVLQNRYVLFIYDFDLVAKDKEYTPEIDKLSDYIKGIGIFSKAYHLKNRDTIFIYFTSPNSNSLRIKTGTISNDDKSFTQKINQNINEYNFNYNVLLNDFVKIDSNRFIYIGLPKNNFN